ncbi:hypothetical protein R1flu_012994 [Riccia fluitans]|uniref:1,4-dihydroxy-2-naphthoyl-CoA synthase n=1 Tax=Riccia fluitans TaxID=41844 RepID=A0ABD1ZG95_9MARC
MLRVIKNRRESNGRKSESRHSIQVHSTTAEDAGSHIEGASKKTAWRKEASSVLLSLQGTYAPITEAVILNVFTDWTILSDLCSGDHVWWEIVSSKRFCLRNQWITINRPECRNTFTVKTVEEMERAFKNARDDSDVGVVILTGKGTEAFCSGGDVGVRSREGYVGENRIPRLNVLDLQIQIRRLPKPVIAMVAGYAVGGGHVLQLICDLTIAADNAVFGQTGPKVGSFDAGFGVSAMTHMIGARKTREVWFLTRLYDAQEALNMGLCNTVVPLDRLEQETVKWCREILQNSPTSIRVLKAAINATEADSDAQAMAGNSTLIFYATDEAEEGRKAYMEKRKPDFSKFKRLP